MCVVRFGVTKPLLHLWQEILHVMSKQLNAILVRIITCRVCCEWSVENGARCTQVNAVRLTPRLWSCIVSLEVCFGGYRKWPTENIRVNTYGLSEHWTKMDLFTFSARSMLPSLSWGMGASSIRWLVGAIVEAESKWSGVTIAIIIIYVTIELEVEVTRITISIFHFHLNECMRHSQMICGQHVNYTVTAFTPSACSIRKETQVTLNKCAVASRPNAVHKRTYTNCMEIAILSARSDKGKHKHDVCRCWRWINPHHLGVCGSTNRDKRLNYGPIWHTMFCLRAFILFLVRVNPFAPHLGGQLNGSDSIMTCT